MLHRTDPSDSAGRPWAGRSFEQNAHAADDGSAPEHLMTAISRFHSGQGSDVEVVDAVRDSRFLIPLIAQAGDIGHTEDGVKVDKTQELSIVTVEGPDGRRVLPVFSSVDAMQRWNRAARPVPADGIRVALAAASEKTDLVVIDPTSETEFALRRPAVWAVAQSAPWTPSFADPLVTEAFVRSIGSELGVIGVRLAPGDPGARLHGPELVVQLELVHGLSRDELDAIMRRLAQRWAVDEIIATRVDSLKVNLVASDDEGPLPSW
ncbi:hypothetical protein GCM10027416_25290 [Okibacterium endophyticum]